MVKIVPTETIEMDGQKYEVARMSQPVRDMIALLDDWRQYEADRSSELSMSQAALLQLQSRLQATLLAERESATKAAEALGLLPNLGSSAPHVSVEIDPESEGA